MATKASDILNRLPSASELLEKQPIRSLAERWNRSIVAAGVRSFLDELRSDLERRAADVRLPSVRELAERAARHVVQLQQPSARLAINATGRFFDRQWIGLPLADEALERSVNLGSGFILRVGHATRGDVAAALCRVTGAEAATVTHSYTGAAWLAIAAVAGGREILVAAAEMGDLDRDCSLASVAASAGVALQPVGNVNRITANDIELAVNERTAALVRHTPDHYLVVGDVTSIELDALVGLSRDRELPLMELAGAAPLGCELPALENRLPSVAESIAAGAHLVIVRGDGLVGGPPCGILVGTRELVERVEAHPLYAAWQATSATSAALAATLELDVDAQAVLSTPLRQLLSTSVENLRQRAERIAPQLAQAGDVESAIAACTESRLGLARWPDTVLPSFGIALSAVHGELQSLDRRLQSAATPVISRGEGDRLMIDLRTVLPRQDQRLIEVVVGRMQASFDESSPHSDRRD